MEAKKRLAQLVVGRFHGAAAAEAAAEAFVRQYQAREVPDDVREVPYETPLLGVKLRIWEVVAACHLASSASEARRLVQQGGIRIDGDRIEDPYQTVEIRPGDDAPGPAGPPGFCPAPGRPGPGSAASGKTP